MTTTINTDLVTPLGAYLRLRDAGRASFLLESVERGRLGRNSWMGAGSRLVDLAEAESLAIEALRSDAPPVRTAGARALGRLGTVGAVAALHEAMNRGELPRGAGRQAIAGIQSRLAGAAPGQLSLAGGEAGALSLADGEPGRLSLADDEPETSQPPQGREGVRS